MSIVNFELIPYTFGEMYDREGEKCGLFAAYNVPEAAKVTYDGIARQQHRGYKATGMAADDGHQLRIIKGTGEVRQVYKDKELATLRGRQAMAHTRYETSVANGGAQEGDDHTQPVGDPDSGLYFMENGNVPVLGALKESVSEHYTEEHIKRRNDAELMADDIRWRIKEKRASLPDAVRQSYPNWTGAVSNIIMDKRSIVAVRGPHGIKPLVVGQLNGGFVFASETCAFKAVGAEFLRVVEPGEMVTADERGLTFEQIGPESERLEIHDNWEHFYFADPASIIQGQSVYQMRKRFGANLAIGEEEDIDVVVAVPDSGRAAATGYAAALRLPLEEGLVTVRGFGRTFIHGNEGRADLVRRKYNSIESVVKGKSVGLIDDSLVRGTTMGPLVEMLKAAGAAEVHVRIACPPIRFPHLFGIDIEDQKQLIAANMSIEEMAKYFKASSLRFITYPRFIEATGIPEKNLMTASFTGKYPLPIGHYRDKISYKVAA